MRKKVLLIFFSLMQLVSLVSASAGLSGFGGSPGGISAYEQDENAQNESNFLTINNQFVNSAALTQYSFTVTDWQNVLSPVVEAYANSGLTCWWGKNQILYDYELSGFPSAVNNLMGRSDVVSYSSVTGKKVLLKSFLQNQSNLNTGEGWDFCSDYETIENFIQSGFANSVAQYSSALIENFAGRAALLATLFQSNTSNPWCSQTAGGLLGYNSGSASSTTSTTPSIITSPYGLSFLEEGQTYNEQVQLNEFLNSAQLLFQRARYARSMYQFPQFSSNATVSLASYTTNGTVSQPAKFRVSNSSVPVNLFQLPTNSNDLATVTNNSSAVMGPVYGGENSSLQPLGPVATFCGVIVIEDPVLGNPAQQVQAGLAGACRHTQLLGQTPDGKQIKYANTYFLPAVNYVTASVPAPESGTYPPFGVNEYVQVDQDSNVNGKSVEPIIKVVSFNTNQEMTFEGQVPNGTYASIIVSDTPAIPQNSSIYNTNGQFGIFGQDPVGINFLYGQATFPLNFTSLPSNVVFLPLNFSTTSSTNAANDFQNFFAYPSQWAVVLKLQQVQKGGKFYMQPTVLGLVKLNPYDFPLNFTSSQMQTFLNISSVSQNSQEGSTGSQTADGMSSLSNASNTTTNFGQLPIAPASAITFSQKDVWDGVADLYSKVFPEGYNTDSTVISSIQKGTHPVFGNTYPFSYLLLQGLMNGLFMSNTYNVMFNMTNWPKLTTINNEYETYYGYSSYAGNNIAIDQVFPTPLVSDWVGNNSPLDWLYLRALMAMRLMLQSIYCTYDLLVMPVADLYELGKVAVFEKGSYLGLTETKNLPISSMVSLLEYMFAYPTQTVAVSVPIHTRQRVISKNRMFYGQNYTSGTTGLLANTYQWILPFSDTTSPLYNNQIFGGN